MGMQRYSPQEQEFYRNYLNSPLWRARRKQRLIAAGGRCEWAYDRFTMAYQVAQCTNSVRGVDVRNDGVPKDRCARTRYLCVHHNTYDRLGDEQDGDLDVYCYFHHMLEHLLWKRCSRCGSLPCLGNDDNAEKWLGIVFATIGIDLDKGPINWRDLPTKEYLLDLVPGLCPICLDQTGQ